jgi:hypothetical protein
MLREFTAHPLQLLDDQLSMVGEGRSSGRDADTTAVPVQQRGPEALFHQPNSLAGRSQRQTGPCSTMRDACRFDHKQEETQINEIEAHRGFHGAFVPSALP